MSVLIFADTANGKVTKSSLEAVYYGSKIASQSGTDAIVISYGDADNDSFSKLGNYGAAKVLVDRNISNADPQKLIALVAKAAGEKDASIIIFSHDIAGKAIAPGVSARLGAGLVAGAVDFPVMNGSFTVRKNVFSGNAFANYEIHTDIKIISILPNSIPVETSDAVAEVADFSGETVDSSITLKEVKQKDGDGVSLTEAELVVSAGRGLKGPENWGMIEELAKVLGAGIACTRPVTDVDWRPHHEHVGQTGTTIRPNLYIAIGISGAIQHLAGVNGSKVIVVVNTDKEAPFFKAADYGIVGDAFDVVPKLIEAVKQLKAENN